jgi:hypothetical protein
MGELFLSVSDDPRMVFEFEQCFSAVSSNGCFMLEVDMDWPKSVDHLVLSETVTEQAARLEAQQAKIADLEAKLSGREKQLAARDNRIIELLDQVKERDAKIHIQEFKLDLLRKTRLAKLLRFFR